MYLILPQSHEEGPLRVFIQDPLSVMREMVWVTESGSFSMTDVAKASNLNLLGFIWPKGVTEIF